MKLEISCDTEPMELLASLEPPDGITVRTRSRFRESLDNPSVLEAVILSLGSFGSGVTASIVANYIYDGMKRKIPKTIRINRKETVFTRTEITRTIEEQIELSENDDTDG